MDYKVKIKQNQIWRHNKSGRETYIYDYHKERREVILPTWGLLIVQEDEFREKFTFISEQKKGDS
jgi:hypothetical protein